MRKTIVFDFDKTLTYRDSLLGFYCSVSKNSFFFLFKIFIYSLIMIAAKLKLLSNTKLKKLGVYIFLSGINEDRLNLLAENYSKKINFNKLYYNYNFDSNNDIYVVSASFQNYIEPCFPVNIKVFGSELSIKNKKVRGLKLNCYKSKKAELLNQEKVTKIDILYTDSFSDYPLAKMAKKIIIIDGDKDYTCNNINSFKSYFKRI